MNELYSKALSTETLEGLLCFGASYLPGIRDVVLLGSATSTSVSAVVGADNLTLPVTVAGVCVDFDDCFHC